MFNNLGDRFKDIFKKVSGQGKLTEANMKDALREVRLALLEADVNYGVAKNFVSKIREKALGEEVISGVNPTQQFVKIVHDELVEVLGGTNVQIAKSPKNPTIIMLSGLQGQERLLLLENWLSISVQKEKLHYLLELMYTDLQRRNS